MFAPVKLGNIQENLDSSLFWAGDDRFCLGFLPFCVLAPQDQTCPDLLIVYMLEFKRSTDRDEGFLEVKQAEANEQHKSIIGALKTAAPKWEFEQINFVVGNRGSVVESDFYTKLLMYKKGKKTSSSPIM